MTHEKAKKARLFSTDSQVLTVLNGDITGKLFVWPEGPLQINELGDAIFNEAREVPYHTHTTGCETFVLLKGGVEIHVNHKKAIISKGDLMHIRSHVHHGFRILEPGSEWREMFQEMDMYGGIQKKDTLRTYSPELLEDPVFNAERTLRSGTSYGETPPLREVAKGDIPEIKAADRPFSTTQTPLGDFHLRVPRWELDGVKEIWQFDLVPGASLAYQLPFDSAPMYHVLSGSLHVETDAEAFEAAQGDLVYIPHYLRHTLTVGAEGVSLLALNVQSRLGLIFEQLGAVPSDDWDTIQAVLRQHNCWLTACTPYFTV